MGHVSPVSQDDVLVGFNTSIEELERISWT
jgi:hypothetical protein